MSKISKSLARFMAERPKTVLGIILAVTVVFGLGFPRLRVDADMTDDIPATVPEKAFYDEVGKIFPTDDFLLVALSSPEGVFSPGMLRQVSEWTDALEGLDGVKKVISLSNAGLIKGTEDGLVIEDAMSSIPTTPGEIAAFKARVEKNDMTASLIGKDGLSTSILLTVKDGVDTEPLPRVRIRLPAGATVGQDFLDELGALSATPEGGDAPVPAVRRVYLPSSEEDRRGAAALYNEKLDSGAKGGTVLVALERGLGLKETGAAVIAAAKARGWKADATATPVTAYERVKGAIDGLPRHVEGKVYVSGSKAVSSIVGKLLITDLSRLFPAVIVIIALILFLSFKTARGVLIPLGNVIISVSWAMGLMGLLGQPITMASMILPIILIAVGTAYTIHVINRYYEDLVDHGDKKEAIASTVSHVTVPVFLAGGTTVVGFGSLAISSIPALQMFGILSALGIFFAMVLALTYTPAVLVLLPRPKSRTVEAHDDSRLARALAGLGKRVAEHPKTTLAACLAFIAGIGAFAPLVSFETNTLNSFKPGSEIRDASEYLNANFSGITVMTVVVKTDEDGAILDPAVLRGMDDLQSRLELLRVKGKKVLAPGDKGYDEASPVVGGSQSIVTFVKGINRALNADDPAFNKVPDDLTPVPVTTERYALRGGALEERDSETGELLATYAKGQYAEAGAGAVTVEVNGLSRRIDLATGKAVEEVPGRAYVGQLVFQYENSGDPTTIEGFIDNPRRTARVNIFIRSASSGIISQVQAKARAYIKEDMPQGAKADITGLSNLTLVILRLLVQSQISSVASSFIICLLFIALMARNLVEGVFSIIPLSGALIINFGTMGIFGIPIDISTATIASIGIGIGIDYTCHFIERLKLTLCAMDLKKAIEETMRTTGKGIFVNALAVAGGFAALLASQVRGNVFMGILMALIMLTSSAFAVTLLPSILVLVNPKFIHAKALAARCSDERVDGPAL